MRNRKKIVVTAILIAAAVSTSLADDATAGPLDPRGTLHIPIGIPNTLDTLKTFVEAEGNFSPGVGSYGIYFWLFDKKTGRLTAPTMDGVKCAHGLADGRYLIPWSKWLADRIMVTTQVAQVVRESPEGQVFIVGAQVTIDNNSRDAKEIALYVALRPLGPAGFDVKKLTVSERGDALLVQDHSAIVASEKPSAAGVLPTDTIGDLALTGALSAHKEASSDSGNCSGALKFDLTIAAGDANTLGFVCPVLPGRRAVAHQWDGVSAWAQFDLAELNPPSGGLPRPDPGLDYYRGISVPALFAEAKDYWQRLSERVKLDLPDEHWEGAFAAIIGHAALAMNEGAPDVAVVNYNVFNRDGIYVANIFQKSGDPDLAVEAIDYFTKHPFNGRSYPEADNPGQILWAMGQQWQFTHDKAWADRIYPAARKIAEMIEYYRTTDGPHWVLMDSIAFGPNLPEESRKELQPGRCDGQHPEYTEAFDIAGLYAAATLAEATGLFSEAAKWSELAGQLFQSYDNKFGPHLGKGYGSYCVLWPCRLYPLGSGKAYEQFRNTGARRSGGWRYFPLAQAHQGLLAGNREAGYGTLQLHLNHRQMRGWYAFDEGGRSGSGGWRRVRTTWEGDVAMPHGWAIAELWLLLRDCLVFEDSQQLVLLAGIPPAWFTHKDGIAIENLPTHFGKLNLQYKPTKRAATLTLGGDAQPPKGSLLRLPPKLNATVTVNGQAAPLIGSGDFLLPPNTTTAEIKFSK